MLQISRLATLALDLLLPPQCLICDAPVLDHGGLCARCFAGMSFLQGPACVCCAVPFSHPGQGGAGRICPQCADEPPPWRRAKAALLYDDSSRRLILPLKHADRTELAAALGAMMARVGASLLETADVLVPVPLHPSRLRARGYNQSVLLAHAVGQRSGVKLVRDALVRLRPTQSLGELSADQRKALISGVVALRKGRGDAVRGQHVVLVDDVLTSGATASGCTRALLAAGARRVDVLVAARVPDPRLR
jgi:ComF family protein